jgi:hypothetical protein
LTYICRTDLGDGAGNVVGRFTEAAVLGPVDCTPITTSIATPVVVPVCAGAVVPIVVTVNGGTPPYRVNLGSGGGTQQGAGTLVFEVTPAATTTYSVYGGRDANGCPIIGGGSVTVEVVPPPVASAGPDQVICVGGSTAGLGGNPPGAGSGLWTVVGGGAGTFTPDAATPDAKFIHADGDGPIALRWTVSRLPCSPASDDVLVHVRAHAAADFNNDCAVNGSDYDVLLGCMTGPGIPYVLLMPMPGCKLPLDPGNHIAVDLNSDGFVDMSDFGLFQRCYGWPDLVVDPACSR